MTDTELIALMRQAAPLVERLSAAYPLHGLADRQSWSASRLRAEADYLETHTHIEEA